LRIAQTASVLNSSFSSVIFYKDSFKQLSKLNFESKPVITKIAHETPPHWSQSPISIFFDKVSFAYPLGKKILNNFQLKVEPGEFLLIRGPSGAGKSTIIKLLVGMESPQSGQIMLDGIDPKPFLDMCASSISYVGPEPFLIPGSVRENLHYGSNLKHEDNIIWKVLNKMSIAEVVQEFTTGLEEFLTEETQMSTGQKQRLSFARAILREPRLLILDEATANIDIKTEEYILNYLKEIKGEVTIIAITHRESFNSLADRKLELGAL
jgi:ABC-type multidrug transport system fused ATPase/permease subunit